MPGDYLLQLDDDTIVFGSLRTAMATNYNLTLTTAFDPQMGTAAVAAGNVTNGVGGPASGGIHLQPLHWCNGGSYVAITAALMRR